MNRKWLHLVAASAMLSTGFVLVAAPASAAPDCKTVTTNIVNRPDNGHGTGGSPQPGYWADDTHTRVITICREPAPSASPTVAARAIPVQSEMYVAKGVDNGTFVTRAGATLSPNNGVSLVGGVKGKMNGSFSWKIEAPANWNFFDPSKQAGKTITGDPRTSPTDDNPTTSEWINGWWPGAEVKPVFQDNWSWIYWLCGNQPSRTNLAGFRGEYWWDAAHPASNDGQTPLSGDIRGVQVCPTPSSASPSASVTVSPSVTTTPVGNTDGGESLPLTGAPVIGLLAVGGALAIAGLVARIYGRRRKTKFQA